ncbi:hypothetical protein KUCAC02_037934, partial [Chaenocephalus aceratus]
MERLSCFTHTLQLVIKDGLKKPVGCQRDYAQLKELIEVLDPFLEATDLTQGENCHSQWGCALCSFCHLQEIRGRVRYCGPLKKLRMFSRSSKTPSSTSSRSVQAQLTADLHLIDNQASDPCSKFWQQNKSQFPVLYQVATQ